MTNQINNQSIIPSTDVIQLNLTLKMTTAQVVETSVTVNNNSTIQDYVHPDDQTQSFLIVLFTSDLMKKSIFKRLVYTLPDLSPKFTSKLNLSNTKDPARFSLLASLLDRGIQRVNCLPSRTIVCFIKLYFGTDWLQRL